MYFLAGGAFATFGLLVGTHFVRHSDKDFSLNSVRRVFRASEDKFVRFVARVPCGVESESLSLPEDLQRLGVFRAYCRDRCVYFDFRLNLPDEPYKTLVYLCEDQPQRDAVHEVVVNNPHSRTREIVSAGGGWVYWVHEW